MATPEKMLKMQMQIRQNATELNDYLHDLDSWEKDMRKQDDTFTKMKPKHQERLVPPVRSISSVKKKHKSNEPTEKPKRIRSYDFKSWDKLDVDKMLEDIDDDEVETVESDKKREKLEEDLQKLSLEEKDKGNDHFKASRYEKSVECYTKGMQYDPTNPILPANRAMAYLKMKKYIESETDCTLSLSLDPAYVKAYLRRGSARFALGKIESATRDYNDALKLEPDNRQAKKELEIIKNQTKASTNVQNPVRESKPKKSKTGCRLIHPIKKPSHLQSKKPMRRIHIEEVGHDIDSIVNGNHPVVDASVQSPADIPAGEIDSDLSDLLNPNSDVGTNISERSKLIEVMEEDNSKHNKATKEIVTNNEDRPVNSNCDLESKKVEVQVIPSLPTTCFQFQADVRKLRSSPSALLTYLLQIEPSNIPQLLKDQLDTDMLLSIIHGFMEGVQGHAEFIISFLQNISKARRFDMAAMFLSASDKKDFNMLFDKLTDSSKQTKLLSELVKTYRL